MSLRLAHISVVDSRLATAADEEEDAMVDRRMAVEATVMAAAVVVEDMATTMAAAAAAMMEEDMAPMASTTTTNTTIMERDQVIAVDVVVLSDRDHVRPADRAHVDALIRAAKAWKNEETNMMCQSETFNVTL